MKFIKFILNYKMQTSQLFLEYKNQFIQNCDKLESLSLGGQINPTDFDEYGKLVKNNKKLLRHISVQLCSLNNKKSKQINQVVIFNLYLCQELKPFKDRFRVFQKRHQIISNQRGNDQENSDNLYGQEFSSKMTVKQLQQNDKLSECKKLLYEMEDTSNQISTNLKGQTDVMEKSKNRLFDTGHYISQANSLIDTMISRERRRQSVACMTLVLAVMIIGGLKYCCY